jgi:CBS domain-containing protein
MLRAVAPVIVSMPSVRRFDLAQGEVLLLGAQLIGGKAVRGAKDVMTHCLVSITPEAPIRDAIARMISHQVSGMPVIGADGKLVGMGQGLRRQM